VGKRRSFTLIELLTVIAIISLLLAILLPSLGAARANAKRAVCAANLRQIGVAMRSYLNVSNDRYPYASHMPSITGRSPVDCPPEPLDCNEPVYIADVLAAETSFQPKVFQCPMDQGGGEGGEDRGPPNYFKSYFQTERSSYEYHGSLGYGARSLGGQTIDEYAEQYLQSQLARKVPKDEIREIRKNSFWIFQDFNNFHAPYGMPGARRYLYADGHVTDYEAWH
jgi:prepilin-type N-terminal cleavage/methylation domain-containing protein